MRLSLRLRLNNLWALTDVPLWNITRPEIEWFTREQIRILLYDPLIPTTQYRVDNQMDDDMSSWGFYLR